MFIGLGKKKRHLFSLIMTLQETHAGEMDEIRRPYVSQTGTTYTLEYMIGNPLYVRQGYGALTLAHFLIFFRKEVDCQADTFFIDPSTANQRAKHVYLKAGFTFIGEYILTGSCSSSGLPRSFFMKKMTGASDVKSPNRTIELGC